MGNLRVFWLLTFACLTVLWARPARADIVWLGSGESGTDPFGAPWLFQNSDTAFQGVTSFGMPGRAMGQTRYDGTESVLVVQFEFFDLPTGVVLSDFLPVNTPAMNVEPFLAADLWQYTFPTPTTIRFTPPTADRTLDPMDRFFLFAPFTDDVNFATVNFRATYFTSIPEPGTGSMLAVLIPLVAVGYRRRVRKKMISPSA